MLRSLLLLGPLLAGGAWLQAGSTGAGGQDVPPPPDSVQAPPAAQFRAQRSKEILESLQGTWRLSQFIHSTSGVDDENVFGFASFQNGYGTILFHALDLESDFEAEQLFQATMFHYRIDSRYRLQTSTLIGHSNFSGDFDYEEPMTPREFDVSTLGNSLVLTRPDGSRLHFLRMADDVFPQATLEILREVRGEAPTLGLEDEAPGRF